ncbi:MAG TPA: UvrD-helicase domain-containing protein [Candidatus Acidoferrales bacterium]|nr:UvrD-helicase domain-containing protein [Candidatus Acidoferrales bacterium]
MALTDELNPQQREAVLATDGPVLVLAGAGTGKTRVITYRVAHLIEQGVPGRNILAVTFTNKAAEQMRQRIADLVRSSGHDSSDIWISTFHSFCARLLRREASRAGLPRDFAIYDDDDQTRVVKLALQNLKFTEKELAPRALRERISHAKNNNISPEEMEAEAFDTFGKQAAAVYREYESILQKSAALDFDDLLLRAVKLLREDSQVRENWAARLRFIQVDEFQDTNASQEELVRLLAGKERNVCIVGDEDQSIYSWRGAESGNFQRFLRDFPGARTIRLEENYRSTQVILDAAGGVVSHNRSRLGKQLKATLGAGALLKYYEARDALDEADYICGEVARLLRGDPRLTLAVLYRTAAQSRSFEETLRRLAIRYRVVGGFSFYQRAEVKDALAYIRLLFHPDDHIALLRVLNVPPRGIGKVTIESLRNLAREHNESLWQAIPRTAAEKTRGASALLEFREMILKLTDDCAAKNPGDILEIILSRTGYLDWAEQQDRLDQSSRADNLRELSNAIAEAIEQGQTLEEVLDRAALVSDTDSFDQSISVSLMTLHSAKGLEFDHVFLAGLEEGLLPHGRSMGDENAIEEERRLCYVGMTRAKRTLTLSRAIYRRSWANTDLAAAAPSRFLAEVPGELVEAAKGSLIEPGETRRYEPDPEFYESQFRRSKRFSGRPSAPPSASRAPRRTSNPLIGARVRHPNYGLGTIVQVEDDGDDRRLTVSFQDYGTKKLIERYAHLQIV